MRIAIGAIMHESNTFSPMRTTVADFRKTQYVAGADILARHRGTASEIGGILKVLAEEGVDVLPTLSAWAMPSGVVTRDTYAHLKGEMLRRIGDGHGDLDGVLLTLHGSMTVDGLEDPEGDLLGSIRAGFPDLKRLAATLDHHANVSAAMVRHTDFLVGYRTHPHVDQFAVGALAAARMVELIRNGPVLASAFIKLPLITATENRSEPIDILHADVTRLEQEAGVFTCSFFVGYAWADVNVIGASVLAVTGGDQALADRCANELAGRMWELRRDFRFPLCTPDEAISLGLAAPGRPVVLDELCDCTLGGASGDVVATARRLVERGVRDCVVVGIVDPESVAAAATAGAGQTVRLTVGGRICTDQNPPLLLEGRVRSLHDSVTGGSSIHAGYESDLGRIAVVEAGGVAVILVERAGKIGGPGFLEALGIDPRAKKLIVVKEGLNPLVEYADLAARIIMVDTPGFDPQTLRGADYHRIPRPIFPMDPDLEWAPPR